MKNTDGFSLVEMMIVIALIALISTFVLPNITSYFKVSLNSAAREMASTIKESYNATVITGRVHRIVYDLKENKYWVEGGPANALMETKESREREERRKRYAKPSDDAQPTSSFSLASQITSKKIALPRGVKFEDLITQQSPEPIKDGLAYTHFFPHGLTEKTLIHLKDESDHHLSLGVAPLVGRTDLFERYVDAKEAFGK
ncbi:prepilin-type N-terminal cleavage/methylation domain-containing protein [Bdellovibrionota bacterium FG-2]